MSTQRPRILVALAFTLILGAVRVAESAPPAPPAAAPPAPKPAPPAEKPLMPPTGPAGESKEAVKEAALDLLVAWTEAQNKGDFAAYQALYAKRLVGIRRSGPRMRRFDHKGWMTDRQKMFAKKMEVTVDRPAVTAGATLVRVDFVQSFAQGNFKDNGPKRIDLTREDGAWRITREEMLDSRLLTAPKPSSAVKEGEGTYDFGFFFDGDMVLGKGDASWAKADFVHKGFDGDTIELRAKANEKKLPPEIAKVVADKVRLVRFGGSCVGRVRSPDLRGRVVPHFGSRQAWRDADSALEPAWLMEAWGQSDQALVSIVDGCPEGGFFVRSPSLPEVSPVAPEKPTPALLGSARRAFAELPDYKAIDAEWKASGGKGRWTQGEVEVIKATTAAGPVLLLWVSASEGPGCGGFHGELTALFKAGGKDGGGRIETLWAVPEQLRPVAAFDLDGDALPEILVNGNFWGAPAKDAPKDAKPTGTPLKRLLCRDANCKEPAQEFVTPMNDCPC